MREIIVDSFAGGGGASSGIEMALGRPPDIAINHDKVALSVHAANHPNTLHLPHNIWKVDPHEATGGAPVGLLWASPDCKHFSKAKGGKPVEKNIRDLAWVVVRWAKQVSPRVIILENVEEFADWGPVLENGKPCPERKGLHFKRFVKELRHLGYKVEWRELRACDYGAPTVRKRLFLIARRDGLPIIWPKPTHGPGLLPYRVAADIIDWSLPCPSIFDTSKQIMEKFGLRAIRPLADNTMARVARGVKRYVLDAPSPFIVPIDGDDHVVSDVTARGESRGFIVPITHTGDTRVHGLDEPVRTVTAAHRGEQALVTPLLAPRYNEKDGHKPRVRSVEEPAATITSHGNAPGMLIAPALINTRNGEREGQAPRVRDIDKPYATVTADGSQGAMVAAFLAQHNTDMVGHSAQEPVSTIVQKGCTQAVVSAGLVNMKGAERRQSAPTEPAPTQTAGGWHIAAVYAFLTKYYGTEQDPRIDEPLHTATTKNRFGIVTVTIAGILWMIVDIGMRMLTPRELFRAQGFAERYIIEYGARGEPITKTDQIRLCGNSVCPQVAASLVKANYSEIDIDERGIPAFAMEAAE